MPLAKALLRGLPFGKTKDTKPEYFHRPLSDQADAAGSAPQRDKHRYRKGHQPPRTETPLTPEQVQDLTYILSQPIDASMLASNIANLSPPLTRPHQSDPAACLCDVHTWLNLQWIEHLMDVIGDEMGPRLDSLRSALKELRSVQTDKLLGMLQSYVHIFPATTSDDSQIMSPSGCTVANCGVCKYTSCKACKLSHFFQNTEAVKALSTCAKGRKKKKGTWPETCAWLDPDPGPGWEQKWKKEGLAVKSDRIIVRAWKKARGPERMTEAVIINRSEVLADRAAVPSELDETENTMSEAISVSVEDAEETEEKRVTGCSIYDAIVERNWSFCGSARKSSETEAAFCRMGLDREVEDEEEAPSDHDSDESNNDAWCEAYNKLVGNPPGTLRRLSEQETGLGPSSRSLRPETGCGPAWNRSIHDTMPETPPLVRDSISTSPEEDCQSFDSWIESYADDDMVRPLERNSFDTDYMDGDDGEGRGQSRPFTWETSYAQFIGSVPPPQVESTNSLPQQQKEIYRPSWRPHWRHSEVSLAQEYQNEGPRLSIRSLEQQHGEYRPTWRPNWGHSELSLVTE